MAKESAKSNGVAPISLFDVVMTTLHHWKFIVLSVCICLGIAVVYIVTTNPKYSRNSQVLITDSSKGNTVNAKMAAMAGMGLLGANAMLDDEIAKMASPDVLKEVIKRLGLDISYSEWGFLKNTPLYGNKRPILVSMPGVKENEGLSFEVEVDKNENVTISDIKYSQKKDPRYEEVEKIKKLNLKLGGSVKTPLGEITVAKGPGFKADEDYDILVKHPKMEISIYNLDKPLTVESRSPNGNTIELSFTDVVPQRAEDILRTIVEIYNENEIKQRNKVIGLTTDFIDERISEVSKELSTVENEYYDYRTKNIMTDTKKTAELFLEENKDLEENLRGLLVTKEIVMMLKKHLEDASRNNDLLPLNSGIGGEGIEEAVAAYNGKLTARNRLAEHSSDQHPKVVQYDQELANTRRQILASIDSYVSNINMRIASTKSSQNKAIAQMKEMPKQSQELVEIARLKNIKETLYLYLLQKREENSMSQLNNQMTPQVIQQPFGLSKPVAPRKGLTLAISFVLGFIIPFIVTLGKEILDPNVRDRANLGKLGLSVAGDIPSSVAKGIKGIAKRNKKKEDLGIVVSSGNNDEVNEAFRLLRTQLHVGNGDKKVILVTSVWSQSGKTFVTMNLAKSIVLSGHKTAVVDCDLRSGKLSETLKVSNDKLTSIDGITVAGVTNLPDNPTEVLEGKAMQQLIADLKSSNDVVLIDAPAIAKTADARILARYASMTLLVIKEGSIGVNMLGKLRSLKDNNEFPNIEVVLNQCS